MPVPLNQKRWGGYILAAVVGTLTVTTATITTLALTTLTVTNATVTNLTATNASSTKQEVSTMLSTQNLHASGTVEGVTLISTSASSASMIAGTSAGNRAFTIASTSTWMDFGALGAGTCSATSSVTLAGVTGSTNCSIDVTASNAVRNSASTTKPEAYAEAANTVAIRLCNLDKNNASPNPANGIYTIYATCF